MCCVTPCASPPPSSPELLCEQHLLLLCCRMKKTQLRGSNQSRHHEATESCSGWIFTHMHPSRSSVLHSALLNELVELVWFRSSPSGWLVLTSVWCVTGAEGFATRWPHRWVLAVLSIMISMSDKIPADWSIVVGMVLESIWFTSPESPTNGHPWSLLLTHDLWWGFCYSRTGPPQQQLWPPFSLCGWATEMKARSWSRQCSASSPHAPIV